MAMLCAFQTQKLGQRLQDHPQKRNQKRRNGEYCCQGYSRIRFKSFSSGSSQLQIVLTRFFQKLLNFWFSQKVDITSRNIRSIQPVFLLIFDETTPQMWMMRFVLWSRQPARPAAHENKAQDLCDSNIFHGAPCRKEVGGLVDRPRPQLHTGWKWEPIVSG